MKKYIVVRMVNYRRNCWLNAIERIMSYNTKVKQKGGNVMSDSTYKIVTKTSKKTLFMFFGKETVINSV